MTDKPRLHQSGLNMLSRCGMQYFYRYVEKVIAPPAVAMIEGTAVHETIHENLAYKRSRGELLPDEHVADLAAERLRVNWLAEEPKLDEEESRLGEKNVRGMSIDRTVKLARLHHVRLAPVIRPKWLERTFELELEGYPVNLGGTIDIQEENRTLRDSKTTRKTPTQEAADNSLQLDMYHLAATVLDEDPPTRLFLDFMVGQRAGCYQETFETHRDETDHQRILDRVEAASKVIEAGAFMPVDSEHWICSAKWCGYFERCPFGARRRKTFGQGGIDG